MKFKVLVARHLAAGGQSYVQGDIVETAGDLTIAFPGKFEKVQASAVVSAAQSAAKASPVVPSSTPAGEVSSPFGEDVSEDFPSAVGADLKVFQKGSGYFVVDMDNEDEALNPKALKGSEVNKFIKAHLKA